MLKYRVLTEIVGLKGDYEFKFAHCIFLKKTDNLYLFFPNSLPYLFQASAGRKVSSFVFLVWRCR